MSLLGKLGRGAVVTVTSLSASVVIALGVIACVDGPDAARYALRELEEPFLKKWPEKSRA